MKFIVISETGVYPYNSYSQVKKDVAIERSEFTKVGSDYVVNMTDMDFTISRDIKQLETVASKKIFAKDNFDLGNWLSVLILVAVLLTRG